MEWKLMFFHTVSMTDLSSSSVVCDWCWSRSSISILLIDDVIGWWRLLDQRVVKVAEVVGRLVNFFQVILDIIMVRHFQTVFGTTEIFLLISVKKELKTRDLSCTEQSSFVYPLSNHQVQVLLFLINLFLIFIYDRPCCSRTIRQVALNHVRNSSKPKPTTGLVPLAATHQQRLYHTTSKANVYRMYMCVRPKVFIPESGNVRGMASIVRARSLLKIFKIRYIVIGSAVVGGVTLQTVNINYKIIFVSCTFIFLVTAICFILIQIP